LLTTLTTVTTLPFLVSAALRLLWAALFATLPLTGLLNALGLFLICLLFGFVWIAKQFDDLSGQAFEKTNLFRCLGGRDRCRGQGRNTLDRCFRAYDLFRQSCFVDRVVVMFDLDLVASLVSRDVVVADPLYFVMRCVEVGIWNDQHLDLLTTFNFCQVFALLVEKEGCHGNGQDGAYLSRALLERFFLN